MSRMRVCGGLLVAGLAAGACGGTDTDGAGPVSDNGTMNLALSGGDFTGNSVRIVGTRVNGAGLASPADSKYRCDSAFDACFDLTGSNPAVSVDGLCPSKNFPQNGYWTFRYEVYSSGCVGGAPTGTLLNDPDTATNPYNFECYDSRDLFRQAHPNETYQVTVAPGQNDASIACLTTNGTQNFAFSSCAIENQSSSELVLDCGCTYSGSACSCAALSGTNLQNDASATCVIDASAPLQCAVVCCATGLHACTGACVNFQTDPNHCGNCATACSGGTPNCVAGVCAP
jgi:hypothetical protein